MCFLWEGISLSVVSRNCDFGISFNYISADYFIRSKGHSHAYTEEKEKVEII